MRFSNWLKNRDILTSYSNSEMISSEIESIEDMMIHHDRILDSEEVNYEDLYNFLYKIRRFFVSVSPPPWDIKMRRVNDAWEDTISTIDKYPIASYVIRTLENLLLVTSKNIPEKNGEIFTKAMELIRSLMKRLRESDKGWGNYSRRQRIARKT